MTELHEESQYQVKALRMENRILKKQLRLCQDFISITANKMFDQDFSSACEFSGKIADLKDELKHTEDHLKQFYFEKTNAL